MPKHNNAIQRNHFHKDWQNRVKTWFDQPARKKRRRNARIAKAARVFPRPAAGPLRPIVHAPTIRYNAKVRLGRGFSLDELKEAKIARQFAQTIGIAVDHRRKNKSEKSFKTNVQRLKEYKTKLVLFPRNLKKPKAGEATKEQKAKAQQQIGDVLPYHAPAAKLQTVKAKDLDAKVSAYATLRKARSDARLVGVREKRKKQKAEEDAIAAQKSKITAE
jgi:large subunit ribosomal protein L13e